MLFAEMGRIYFPFLFAWEPNRASNLAARALDRACHATLAAIAAQPKESGRQFVLHLHTHVHYKHIPFVVSRRPPPFVSVHQFLIFNERRYFVAPHTADAPHTETKPEAYYPPL